MGNWSPTRWQRFCWAAEDWAPYVITWPRGVRQRAWMHPLDYLALVWHRLGCKLGWVPSAGDPKRPTRRFLVVKLDGSPPPGTTCNPPSPVRGRS